MARGIVQHPPAVPVAEQGFKCRLPPLFCAGLDPFGNIRVRGKGVVQEFLQVAPQFPA